MLKAAYLTGAKDPSKLPLEELHPSFPVDGRKLRISSRTARVGGVSGEADATLFAPCTLPESELGAPLRLRKGVMYVVALTDDAPAADSGKQRRNAADLALSFLRRAVRECDEPPKLPESVRIGE